MHGITGRMGMNQHLERSILPIIEQGGVELSNGDLVLPDPLLIGRNAEKLEAISKKYGLKKFTTKIDEAISFQNYELFFDSGLTIMRPDLLKKAIRAGKHIYCEKPVSLSVKEANEVALLAEEQGIKTGVVQDKLLLPGLIKLKKLVDDDFFKKILSVKIDFGYWVFTGETTPSQRPGWNYQKSKGGGIIFDMFCHWQYVLENLFGKITSIICQGANHIGKRWDENTKPYTADADDAAYAILCLENDIVVQINSSWCTRVNRDDLVIFHVDGTKGSAVAGLTKCKIQSLEQTPRPIWNPDEPQTMKFTGQWDEVYPELQTENGFKQQWEMFIRYLYEDSPWKFTLQEAARGVRLAECAITSWSKRKWIAL